MRHYGHGVSNARASLLLRIIKAEDAVTPHRSGNVVRTGR
jgi:hypothetical protein